MPGFDKESLNINFNKLTFDKESLMNVKVGIAASLFGGVLALTLYYFCCKDSGSLDDSQNSDSENEQQIQTHDPESLKANREVPKNEQSQPLNKVIHEFKAESKHLLLK